MPSLSRRLALIGLVNGCSIVQHISQCSIKIDLSM
jgi:hypothetical protein